MSSPSGTTTLWGTKIYPIGWCSIESGVLWFFGPSNLEFLVKVLNGCGVNSRIWVYAAASTDVAYTLTVTDTTTGEQRTYHNALGNAADAIGDTNAFATCP